MKYLYVLLLACVALNVNAQNDGSSSKPKVEGRTAFYAEIGGAGILFSANIDHRFKPSQLGLGIRGGVGFITTYEEINSDPNLYEYRDVSILTVPVQINYIFGKDNSPHTFEVGGGLTVTGRKIEALNFYDDRKSQVFGNFSFMYRRQPKDGGFMWRIGFTPLVSRGYIQPFGGVSIGYSF